MRKSIALFLTLFVIGLTTIGCAPADAQQTRTLHDDQWCDRDNWEHDNDGERYCEVREITLPAGRDLITVDGRQNGGIKVEGWNRKEILVRAKVTTHARTEAAAERLAEDIEINTDRTIFADVPETRRKEWASVSYRLMVPRRSNLSLETFNGGISIENVEGDMDFAALNGGLNLIDLAGDVHGETTNGGITVELTGKGEGPVGKRETSEGRSALFPVGSWPCPRNVRSPMKGPAAHSQSGFLFVPRNCPCMVSLFVLKFKN